MHDLYHYSFAYRVTEETLAYQDQKDILEHQESLDIQEHLDNQDLKGLQGPKVILAIKRIVYTVKTTMLIVEMMVNRENLVIQVQLVKRVLLDHQEMMLSAILERMASLVILVNLEKMEKRESLGLLVLQEVVVFTKLLSMASALKYYSTKLHCLRREFIDVVMDTTIIRGIHLMLN